ncbi:unnamed protein product [Musa textilis]
MESFDAITHLPPRKRLLAELRRENSEFDFLPPVPCVSGDLGARLRDIINSPSSTLEEIVKVSKSVALAAAEISATARNNAVEKAAAATKAKAAAKSALLYLDSVTRKSRKGYHTRAKVRKKQVPIKLLYKNSYSVGSQKTDEELARKLHLAMNSSPRISDNKAKNSFGKEVVCNSDAICIENSHVLHHEGVRMNDKCFIDKSEGKDVIRRKEEVSSNCTEKQQDGSKFRSLAGGRKVRIKQKKLPLSQYDVRGKAELKRPLANHYSFTGESKLDCAQYNTSADDAGPSNDGGMSMEIASAWKCKKIRASQCSSDGKILRALC